MQPSDAYKVFFHSGDELGIKTRVHKGHAYLDESGLHVRAPEPMDIAFTDLGEVTLDCMASAEW